MRVKTKIYDIIMFACIMCMWPPSESL